VSEMGDSDYTEARPAADGGDAAVEPASETGGGSGEQSAREAGESGPAVAGPGEGLEAADGRPPADGGDAGTESSAEAHNGFQAEGAEHEPGEGEPSPRGPAEGNHQSEAAESDAEPGAKAQAGEPGEADPAETEDPVLPEAAEPNELRPAPETNELAEASEADRPPPPPPDAMHVPPERAAHILDGDTGGGGHRHGTGLPGKTEFPADWNDEKIIGHVTDVARSIDDGSDFQSNGRWREHGERDGVGITVIAKSDGTIWAAWPDASSPGVVKNPKERK
jgi:Bacterial EndoU nuclease